MYQRIPFRHAAVTIAMGLAMLPSLVSGQPFASDPQSHAGRAWRVQKTTTGGWGDTRVVESIAGHVIIFARHRYGLDSVVTDPQQIKRATKEMYDFLSWKYGNPSAVTAQWISAGYRHFDGHVAEAGMALLGTDLEGPGEVIRLPAELSAYLKSEVDKLASDDTSGVCARLAGNASGNASSNGMSGGVAQSGTSSTSAGSSLYGFACKQLITLVAEAAKVAVDRLGISSAALGGAKRVNWRDPDVTLALYARRNPQLWSRADRLPGRRVDPSRGRRP